MNYIQRGLLTLVGVFSLITHSMADSGDKPQYAVSKIDPELKKGKYSVVRVDEMELDVITPTKALFKTHYVITIFNKKAEDLAEHAFTYDNETVLSFAEARVYDQNGDLLDRIKAKDMKDEGTYRHTSLFDDNRRKVVDLKRTTYPYTVEFVEEKVLHSTMFLPSWVGFSDRKMGVESSIYKVTAPAGVLKYKQNEMAPEPVISKQEGKETYVWKLEQEEGIRKFEKRYPIAEQLPSVTLAANVFAMDGHQGDYTSWKTFGKWIWGLNKGQDVVPEELKYTIHSVTDTLQTSREKAKAVYEFVQQNTHYVNLSLGIGGFKPFSVEQVYRTGYGDCKALTNYTYSLLKEVGVPSVYTLVRAGRDANPIDTTFVASQFNHVILSVPLDKDTVFLECTSQDVPFGFIGGFTDDRDVLFITEEGGELGRTKRYTQEENVWSSKMEVLLDEEGVARSTYWLNATGMMYDNFYFMLGVKEREKQIKFINRLLEVKSMEIGEIEMEEERDVIPTFHLKTDFESRLMVEKSVGRFFITPNQVNALTSTPKKAKNRKNPFYQYNEDIEVDTVVWQLPEGYSLENKPADIQLKCPMGTFEATYNVEGSQLTYTRKLALQKGVYAPELYNEYVEFLRSVKKADREKVTFHKQEEDSPKKDL
ncbi:DUF3857 domain-containing protein [Algivirga pacifica]|uniref:DUF3857 domain-containing protein n=1 Tax=Algivirga pacifica TaxID=1162670 RepID=A0ABP9D422_9BACT